MKASLQVQAWFYIDFFLCCLSMTPFELWTQSFSLVVKDFYSYHADCNCGLNSSVWQVFDLSPLQTTNMTSYSLLNWSLFLNRKCIHNWQQIVCIYAMRWKSKKCVCLNSIWYGFCLSKGKDLHISYSVCILCAYYIYTVHILYVYYNKITSCGSEGTEDVCLNCSKDFHCTHSKSASKLGCCSLCKWATCGQKLYVCTQRLVESGSCSTWRPIIRRLL